VPDSDAERRRSRCHSYDQSDRVRELFTAAGFTDIVAARDLAGILRVVAGRTPF
jgi:hypothetical protein